MNYTPDEISELLKERPNQAHYIAWLVQKAVTEAVLFERERALADFAHRARVLFEAEREACAKLCDEMQEHYASLKDAALLNGDVELSNASSGEPRACEFLAAAIRARGDV